MARLSVLCVLQATAVLFQGALASGSHATDVDTYCQLVEAKIPNRISYPASSRYTESIGSYYSGQEQDLQPACVFQPQSANEVSTFVKLVTSRAKGCSKVPKFAVRSGGHTIWQGAANIEGGITVDMRAMNATVLNRDKSVVSIGTGALWSNVYPQLVPHNLTVMGGRVTGIGVGGLATGGGIHFLSRRNGWVCDNINGYQVVLANGDVVEATASSHRDLWLALKGGSNNFGIVTRIDAPTWSQGNMLGGAIGFNYTQDILEAHAHAFSNIMDARNFDDAADFGMVLQFTEGAFAVADTLFYVDPVESPAVYKEFLAIQPRTLSGLKIADAGQTVRASPGTLPSNTTRAIDIVYSFKSGDAKTYRELFDAWEAGVRKLANIAGLQLVLLIQPHPVTKGINSLGLQPGQTDEVLSVLTASFARKQDDATVQAGMQAIVDAHVTILKQRGLYIPFQYLNYADHSQDPIGGYGKEVKARLQSVSKAYDPNGVFQKQMPGGFKLFQ